jgi:ribose transport system substrate-binding protein
MRSPGRWRLATAALVAALAAGATACGSSDDGGSSGSSTAAAAAATSAASDSSVDLAALKRVVLEHSKPGKIGPTVPIKGPIPKDVYAIYINCGAPACLSMQQSFQQAATVLGWKVDVINAKPTPEAIQNAFGEAVRRKPDAVVTTGFAISQYPKQAKELNRLGIPILSNTGTDPSTYDPKQGVTLQLQPVAEVQSATALLADKALVDAGGEAAFGTVLLTGYPSVKFNVEGFENEIKAKCPKCTTKQLSIQPTSIGKDAPTLVANFLRANPSIKSLYFGYDAMAQGLGAALKGAGISMPKTYSWAPDDPGVQELQTGEKTAAVPLGYPETGWQFADALARLKTGGDVKDSQKWQPYIIWSKSLNNVPTSTKNPPAVPDYQEQFKKLWGIG